jgi:hypothetical protein
MKKFVVITALIFMAVFVGCGSSGNLAGISQRVDKNLPKWAGEGISFFTSETDLYNAPKIKENGLYACGMSESLDNPRLTYAAARLSANRALAGYINTEIKSAEKRITTSNDVNYKQIDESYVNAAMKGARIVDNYIDEYGNVYSLAFISETDLKKSLTGSENIVEEIFNK